MVFPRPFSNPSETLQANIIACSVVTWVIAAVFVGLRFYARGRLLGNVIATEDWLILVALVFSGATSAGMIERESRCFSSPSLLCTLACRAGS